MKNIILLLTVFISFSSGYSAVNCSLLNQGMYSCTFNSDDINKNNHQHTIIQLKKYNKLNGKDIKGFAFYYNYANPAIKELKNYVDTKIVLTNTSTNSITCQFDQKVNEPDKHGIIIGNCNISGKLKDIEVFGNNENIIENYSINFHQS